MKIDELLRAQAVVVACNTWEDGYQSLLALRQRCNGPYFYSTVPAEHPRELGPFICSFVFEAEAPVRVVRVLVRRSDLSGVDAFCRERNVRRLYGAVQVE